MKTSPIIHPFLFAIFPILFLFSHNIRQLSFSVILAPAAIVLILTILLLLSCTIIIGNRQKAGILVSTIIVLFFAYGHIHGVIQNWRTEIFDLGRHRYILSVWIIIFCCSLYFIIKTRRNLRQFTNFLNISVVTLVLISLVNIGIYWFKTGDSGHGWAIGTDVETYSLSPGEIEALPDIYYIILDGYSRADVLDEIYQYDNTGFINFLIQKGFYVAEKSNTNYIRTSMSLASSLNFDYLKKFIDQAYLESQDCSPLSDLIKKNSVFDFLKRYGYISVAFSTGYSPTEIRKADVFITSGISLNEFENELINTTIMPIFLEKLLNYDQYDIHRQRILYTLDHLADIPDFDKPKFVFAHVFAPHPPFVLGENGENIQPDRYFNPGDGSLFLEHGGTLDEYLRDYKRQLQYVNKRIMGIIEKVLEQPVRPVIIIIQGDHGSRRTVDWKSLENTNLKEAFPILNAYYLPDGGYNNLYNSISPVNSFRIILNQYFGTDYDLLPDESFYAIWDRPYDLVNVTDKLDSEYDR